jgi:hypothetical protein
MRHEYSNATTARYLKWLGQRIADGETDPPRLADIESWLGREEEYRNPLRALMDLCFGLREAGYPAQIHWIACELAREVEEERAFGRKAEAFFSAMINRCGVEDFDVVLFDKQHRRCGTLHEHHTQEPAHDIR